MVNQDEIKNLENEYDLKIDNFTDTYKNYIINQLKRIFAQGVLTSSKLLNKEPKDYEPTKRQNKIFESLVFESIKGVNEDMRKEISLQLNMGLSQQETKKQLRDRLDNMFKGDNPTKLKYENRLKLILRTESSRIFNSGSFVTAKQLKAKYKYLIGTNDNRQGKDSKVALRKYGTPEQAIPIDDYFEFTEGRNKYKYKFPPNRPNDRETCMYIYEKPNKTK